MCVEINDKHVHEDVLGGVGYSEIFLSCVTSLEGEELVVRSPRGQRLKVLLDALRTLEQQKVAGVAISLIVTVNVTTSTYCIIYGLTKWLRTRPSRGGEPP